MFSKYIGKFHKYEAEAVQEILDMHDGDEILARASLIRAMKGDVPENFPDWYQSAIEGLCFMTPRWWEVGLEHRGLLKKGEALAPIPEELI